MYNILIFVSYNLNRVSHFMLHDIQCLFQNKERK